MSENDVVFVQGCETLRRTSVVVKERSPRSYIQRAASASGQALARVVDGFACREPELTGFACRHAEFSQSINLGQN